MKIVPCPKCKSENVEWLDTNHQELDLEQDEGYTDAICECLDCGVNFSIWIDFDITNIRVKVEDIWNENDED